MYVVKQNGKYDCASSSLLSIIRHYKSNYNKEELSVLLKESNFGTSMYDLVSVSNTLGFYSYGLRTTLNDTLILPCILHTKINNNYHYIVLYKIKNNNAYLMDPKVGKVKMKMYDLNKIYTGVLVILYPIRKLDNIKEQKKYFKLSSFIKYTLIILILSIFVVIISLFSSLFLKIVVDYSLNNKILLLKISFYFIIITFIKTLILFIKNKILIKFNLNIYNKLLKDFILHFLNIKYNYLKTKTTGEIISRVNDIYELKDNILLILSDFLLNILVIIIINILMIFYNIALFKYIFIFSVISFIFMYIIYLLNKKEIIKVEEENINLTSLLTEVIKNVESIKNINGITKINKKIKNKIRYNIMNLSNYYNKVNRSTSLKNLFNDISFIIIILFISINIKNNIFSIGDLIMFSYLLNMVINSNSEIIYSLPSITYTKEVISKLESFLNIKEEKEIKFISTGDIEMKNLAISFNNRDYINKNINLIIKEKEKILIKGKNGIGKSTILKILKKYYDYEGSITIGSKELKNINTSNIIYISQNERLFKDSIKNNICFNTEKNYNETINMTLLNNFINNSIFKNNLLIEEDNFNISGGEKQKIVLARALINDFDYLIMDECLTEIDLKSKITILKNILNKYKDKTIIYVTHEENIDYLFDRTIIFGGEDVKNK